MSSQRKVQYNFIPNISLEWANPKKIQIYEFELTKFGIRPEVFSLSQLKISAIELSNLIIF